MTELTIGLPVYNGAKSIERALLSLLAQSYRDFILLVSDNASVNSTREIVSRIAGQDQRVQIIQQPHNVGAAANFMSLAMNAKTEFFMWAAADDFWSSDYIETAMDALRGNSEIGFASGDFASVDMNGTILRRTADFSMLNGRSSIGRLVKYVSMVEASGKANPIYSVFRTSLLQEVCRDSTATFGEWGGDMAVVAAALSRAGYLQNRKATLFKQVGSASDLQTSLTVEGEGYSRLEFGGAFPPQILHQFIETITRGLENDRQKWVVAAVLRSRRVLIYVWQMRQKLRNLRRRLSGAGR